MDALRNHSQEAFCKAMFDFSVLHYMLQDHSLCIFLARCKSRWLSWFRFLPLPCCGECSFQSPLLSTNPVSNVKARESLLADKALPNRGFYQADIGFPLARIKRIILQTSRWLKQKLLLYLKSGSNIYQYPIYLFPFVSFKRSPH